MSLKQRHEDLMRVAALVSDGTPVNWEEEFREKPEHRVALDRLALLERIREAHTAQPLAPPTPVGSPPPAAPAPPPPTPELDETQTAPPIPAIESGGAADLGAWGPLRLLERVGEGGWGEVYRAFDPTLQTEVALKLLKVGEAETEEAAERLLHEARRLARVRHPNVLLVHGADRHGGRIGIWTEFIRGRSLEAYVEQQGPLSAREAALIGLDLCRALSAVHAAGLVHRDVKARNVMREEGGRIVLMDFGSGAELPATHEVRKTRHIHGTPLTMAPEQLRGEIVGPPGDVYGLGALLYFLASKRYPVEASTFYELVAQHERRARVPLRDRRADLPSDFVQVVERAIAFDPMARYPSAGAVEQALAATLVAPKRWRDRVWIGLAAGVVLVLAVVLVSRRPEPKPEPDLTARASGPAPEAGAPSKVGAILQANATLYRRGEAAEEPVSSGARVAPGDRLCMIVENSEPMNLYVLNQDRAGNVFVLFPIKGLPPSNPLAPAVRHRLPGQLGDSLVDWRVTTAGGRESIVAIGSRGPLEALEREIARFPPASPNRPVAYGRVSATAIRSLRGIGGLSATPVPARDSLQAAFLSTLELLERRREEAGDVWIWKVELENPLVSR